MQNNSSTKHLATDGLEGGANFTTTSVPVQLWWGNKLLGRFLIKISVFNPSEWNCLGSIYTVKISSCYFYSSNDFCSCWLLQKSMKMLEAEYTFRKSCFVKYISQNASSFFPTVMVEGPCLFPRLSRNKMVSRLGII